MQDLRLVLIIVGAIAIVALIVHGIWTSKKHAPKPMKERPLGNLEGDAARDEDGFDIDGIGRRRVVGQDNPLNTGAGVESDNAPVGDVLGETSVTRERAEPTFGESILSEEATRPSVQDGLQEQRQEEGGNPQAAATQTALHQEPEARPVEQAVQASEHHTSESAAGMMDSTVPESEQPLSQGTSSSEAAVSEPAQEVFVLNVVAREGQQLNGVELLPALLTLGFKFGEMNIFHRHQDSAGTGPVLFSLANMVKPGTFDIDNMEQFQTQGVSLFMALPCAGESHSNFKLMLSGAEKLADELDAVMLDGHRNPLTQQTIQHYQDRIREFERKRLLAG